MFCADYIAAFIFHGAFTWILTEKLGLDFPARAAANSSERKDSNDRENSPSRGNSHDGRDSPQRENSLTCHDAREDESTAERFVIAVKSLTLGKSREKRLSLKMRPRHRSPQLWERGSRTANPISLTPFAPRRLFRSRRRSGRPSFRFRSPRRRHLLLLLLLRFRRRRHFDCLLRRSFLRHLLPQQEARVDRVSGLANDAIICMLTSSTFWAADPKGTMSYRTEG